MAGSNGIPKWLKTDREDRFHVKALSKSYESRYINVGAYPANRKYNPITGRKDGDLIYPFAQPATVPTLSLDAQQALNDVLLTALSAGALTGPTAAELAAMLGQEFLTNSLPGETDTVTVTMENNDVTAKTITFGAGVTPSTITLPPQTISEVTYEVTQNNPPLFRVYIKSSASTTSGAPPVTTVPTGILVGSGGAIVAGRTLTSTSPEIVVTNGNGVAGNPSLALTVAPVGQLQSTTLQGDINYLGEIFNVNNGVTVSNAATLAGAGLTVPMIFNAPVPPPGGADSATDPGWNVPGPGQYTVQVGLPAAGPYRFHWSYSGTADTNGGTPNPGDSNVQLLKNGVNVEGGGLVTDDFAPISLGDEFSVLPGDILRIVVMSANTNVTNVLPGGRYVIRRIL